MPRRVSCEGDDGWTKEQETQLHQAHMRVRATPNFWRDIAKQIPGKTASECFNKFYSAHPTPPVHQQQRSRRNCVKSPIKPLANIMSPSALVLNKKKGSKQGLLRSHKVVRQFLRNQQSADQNYEQDAFAALECSNAPSTSSPSSCNQRTSQRKKTTKPADIPKQTMNEKKHDRYLDLLIRRYKLTKKPKKSAAAAPAAAAAAVQSGAFAEKFTQRLSSMKDAKSAILANARELLQHVSENQNSSDDESEMPTDDCDTEDEEEEDEDNS